MKLQRIYALSAKTTQSPIAHLGARSYLQLDLDMTEEQRCEADEMGRHCDLRNACHVADGIMFEFALSLAALHHCRSL
jgi:hypothetical protein